MTSTMASKNSNMDSKNRNSSVLVKSVSVRSRKFVRPFTLRRNRYSHDGADDVMMKERMTCDGTDPCKLEQMMTC